MIMEKLPTKDMSLLPKKIAQVAFRTKFFSLITNLRFASPKHIIMFREN